MKRFEQSIRAVIALFAALFGFGLKNLLDGKSVPDTAIAPCFLITLALFTRFLIGASNHYWYDFVRNDKSFDALAGDEGHHFLGDQLVLMLMGFLGVSICFSRTVWAFFLLHAAFGLLAFGWSAWYLRNRAAPGKQTPWIEIVGTDWIQINVIYCGLSLIVATASLVPVPVLPLPEWGWFPWPAPSPILALSAGGYLWLLVWDVSAQVKFLQQASG